MWKKDEIPLFRFTVPVKCLDCGGRFELPLERDTTIQVPAVCPIGRHVNQRGYLIPPGEEYGVSNHTPPD